MNELMNKSLAQIVTGNHLSAAVFEKYHLDFCCKGKRSLKQACDEQNIAIEELLPELEKIASGASITTGYPFDKLTQAQLIDHIVSTHHAYVKNELPQLLTYAEKVASKHGENHPELFKIFELVAAVKEEMELHMKKEEQVLFPRIQEIETITAQQKENPQLNISYLQAPISIMEQEHDHAGALTAEIRQLTNNYIPPQDACTTYKLLFASLQAFETDLHQHVHLENNLLFPNAIKLFGKMNKPSLN